MIDLTWSGERWLGQISIAVRQVRGRISQDQLKLGQEPIIWLQLPGDAAVRTVDNGKMSCDMRAASTLVEVACFIYQHPLPAGVTSISIPLRWEPPYDWTQLGERRMLFFRGSSTDSALPSTITFRTNIEDTEIAEAMPAPRTQLRDTATWVLPPVPGTPAAAADPERLTEITLVDRDTRFIAQQAVTVLAIGAGTLFGLLAQFSAEARLEVPATRAPNEREPARTDATQRSSGTQRQEADGKKHSMEGAWALKRRRAGRRPTKWALLLLPIALILRRRRRNRLRRTP
jgi:hypothetical protein